MIKFKKIGVLAVSVIMMVSSVVNVYAGSTNGYIYKSGERVGIWYNYMDQQNASAYTMGTTSVYYDKTAYMTVNVQSIYPNGGSHAYYVNASLSAANTTSTNNRAEARKTIPTTERGTSAYTKHVIIIEGTAYTPEYNSGTSNVVRP